MLEVISDIAAIAHDILVSQGRVATLADSFSASALRHISSLR